MDFNQESRGYCYVKYTNKEDANCDMEVWKLGILHSYEKCRLERNKCYVIALCLVEVFHTSDIHKLK